MRSPTLLLCAASLALSLGCAPEPPAEASPSAPPLDVRSVPGEVVPAATDLADTSSAFQSQPAPDSARSSMIVPSGSSDDAPTINLALREAEPGEVVVLGSGVFRLHSEIAMRPGVTLRGAGPSTLLQDERGGTEKVVMFYEDHGARLENLAIRSAASEAMDDLVFVMNSRDVLLADLTLRRFARNAVYVANGENVRIARLDVAGATRLDGGEGYGVHFTKGTRGSSITASDFGPPLRHAVVIQRESHHNRVEGNMVLGPTKDGIDLHGSGEHDNVVVRNTVTGSGSAGIGVGETKRAAGRDNIIEANVLGGNKWGIILHGGSPATLIRGNTIRDSGDHGIYVKDAPETQVLGNMIAGTQRFWGILVRDGTGSVVSENQLHGNAKGIDLGDSPGVRAESNAIED